jgi:uncharacterized membrane protein|tara:strand:+ start:424 stop:1014 length:591 start_codon:yes stop_codon:yes gene_type:complete
MTATHTADTGTRTAWIDRARGLAIVLMVLDHALVAAGEHGHPLRYTATRAALPLFMLCAANVWRPGLRPRRLAWMAAALAVELVTFPMIGLPLPGIMLGIIGVTLLLAAVPQIADLRYSWALTVASFVAWVFVPMPPELWIIAVTLGWWSLGNMAGWYGTPIPDRGPRALLTVGRHPIGFYIGHLAVLAAVCELAR